ncbi:MAG: asparagine synthase (glutamine-hydrolyzing), partial [Clostridia bacterium]|nr:asparagine synthase (glutamine-hydrolyzing) [Clostridia bacterium]
MCGFAGFSVMEDDLLQEKYLWRRLALDMAAAIAHRGPDDMGVHVARRAALAHARLAVMDPEHGAQPMRTMKDGNVYTIVYNGELYNAPELRQTLCSLGYRFETNCDTEVLLQACIHYGEHVAEQLNGIYAFAFHDEARGTTYLCRDRFGVKPLFLSFLYKRLVFASEIKALFKHPGIAPVVGRTGLCEIFGLGPMRTAGCGVFENIRELKPGHCAVFGPDGYREWAYYTLQSREHTDDFAATTQKVRGLLEDIAARQCAADVPLCTFLSGGLDSSVITALVAGEMKKKGMETATYSFDFEGNRDHFTPSAFQPEQDQPWAQRVSALLGTRHTTLVCSNEELADALFPAVCAKDLPGMADVDSSLLYFCKKVKENHTVSLCGECADEIFGGYPWFHREEMLQAESFPWSPDLTLRTRLLSPELNAELHMEDYVRERYEELLQEVPRLPGENAVEARRREIGYLNIYRFMATLLDRKDRCSMASGLEVRVPFADHRLL